MRQAKNLRATEPTLLPSQLGSEKKVILRGLVSWLITLDADLEYELNEICHALLATFFLINNPLIINTLRTYQANRRLFMYHAVSKQAWFFIVSQFEFKIIAKRINNWQFGIRDIIFESHWPIYHLLYVAPTGSRLKTFKNNIFYSKAALWIVKYKK